MSAVLWLIGLLIGGGGVVYLFRRTVWGSLVAAMITLLAAYMMMHQSPGLVLEFLGRDFILSRLTQITLSLSFITSALLFFISAFSPSFIEEKTKRIVVVGQQIPKAHGGIQGEEGRTFYPVSLLVLGVGIVATLSQHLGLTAIFFQAAAILTVFIIQGGRLVSTRAALRFLWLISLATPLFLLAAWQIDFQRFSPDADNTLLQTSLLITIGFSLWLAVVPFHSWLTTTAADSYPASAAFVILLFPTLALTILLNLLMTTPPVVDLTDLAPAILLACVFTGIVGGVGASIQRGFSQLMGYAALYDLGCLLTGLALSGADNGVAIVVNLVARALALSLLAASTAAIRSRHAHDGFAELSGTARQMPVATIGLMIGGCTLAGLPVTVGFMARWQLWGSFPASELHLAVLLGLAGCGVMLGYLRGLWYMLNQADSKPVIDNHEPTRLLLIITILVILCVVGGIFPTLMIQVLEQLLSGEGMNYTGG